MVKTWIDSNVVLGRLALITCVLIIFAVSLYFTKRGKE